MSHQRAVSANAAATARRCFSKPYPAGEVYTYVGADGIGQDEIVSTVHPVLSVRQSLASQRPMDHRWDISRGVVFNNAPRPRDVDRTWLRRGSVSLRRTAGPSRSYPTRTLGSHPTSDRRGSMVNEPYRAPVVNVAGDNALGKAMEAKEQMKRAKDRAVSELNAANQKVNGLEHERNIAQKTASAHERTIKNLNQENKAALEEVDRLIKEKHRELQEAESAIYRKYEMVMENMKANDIKTAQLHAEALREQQKQHAQALREQQGQHAQALREQQGQHAQALREQQQRMQKKHADEVQAVIQRREDRRNKERASYDDFRKVFDTVTESQVALNNHMFLLQSTFFYAAKTHTEQPSYTQELQKFDPWIRHKYANLLDQLERFSQAHHDRWEGFGRAVQSLRLAQQTIRDAFQIMAHDSRRLTKYHRLDERANKMDTRKMVEWMANDRPFRLQRNEVDDEIDYVRRQMDECPTEAKDAISDLQAKLKQLKAIRGGLSDMLRLFLRTRQVAVLEALLQDDIAEKEIFQTTLDVGQQLDQVASLWRGIVGGAPFMDEDSEVTAEKQSTIRQSYRMKMRETRKALSNIEGLVRERSLIEQSLGLTQGREQKLDDVIHRAIAEGKAARREARDRIAPIRERVALIGVSRSAAFARARPVRPTARLASGVRSGAVLVQPRSAIRRQPLGTRRDMGQAQPRSSIRRHPIGAAAASLKVLGPSKTPALTSAQVKELSRSEFRINQLRKQSAASPGKEKKQFRAEIAQLRLRTQKIMIVRLNAKKSKQLETMPEEDVAVKQTQSYIDNIGRAIRAEEGHAYRHPIANSQAVHKSDSSEGREDVQGTGLKLEPTASMQAPYSRWAPQPRHFHATGAELSGSAERSTIASMPKFESGFFTDADPQPDPSTLAQIQIAAVPSSRLEAQSTSTGTPLIVNSIGSQDACEESREYDTTSEVSASDEPKNDSQDANDTAHSLITSEGADARTETMEVTQDGDHPVARNRHSNPVPSGSYALGSACPKQETVENAQNGDRGERSHQLTYQIPPEDYRSAVIASPNTNAAFWSHTLYKAPTGVKPTVHLCTSLDTAEREAQKLLNEPVLGFDLEWGSWAKIGKSSIKQNVSLIQLAAEDKIGLFQLAAFHGSTIEQLMPPSLRTILESDKIIKAGVNVAGDAGRLRECMGVKMQGLFELSHLYKVVTFSDSAPGKVNKSLVSIAYQVQNILRLPLNKKEEVRTSAWSRRLNSQQSEYAAADAYAGLRLFHALEDRRKQMDPVPPRPAFWELNKPLVLGDGTVVKPNSKKHGKRADKVVDEDAEAEEEYFDALETQDVDDTGTIEVAGIPLSGINVGYPSLSFPEAGEETLIEQDVARNAPESQVSDSVKHPNKSEQAAPETSKTSPELELADTWVSRWRASLPPEYYLQVGNSALRAYHLWHVQDFDVEHVAALCRTPPLSASTVAGYILDVVNKENQPFDKERIKEPLRILPSFVHGRYRKTLDKISASR